MRIFLSQHLGFFAFIGPAVLRLVFQQFQRRFSPTRRRIGKTDPVGPLQPQQLCKPTVGERPRLPKTQATAAGVFHSPTWVK